VVGRTSSQPRLHGGGQPAVVSHGQGKPRPGTLRGYLTSTRYTAPSYYDYNLTRVLTYHVRTTMPTGPGRRAAQRAGPPWHAGLCCATVLT